MYCPKCGAPVTGDDRFCEKCGTSIGIQVDNVQQIPASLSHAHPNPHVHQTASAKPKNMFSDPSVPGYEKGQIIAVFFLGLLAAFLLFSSGLSMSGIQSVGGKTMEEIFYKYMGNSLVGMAAFVLACTIYFLSKMTNKYNGRYTK